MHALSVFGGLLHVCLCERAHVHMSAFHLTLHGGPGSICLSDHLM